LVNRGLTSGRTDDQCAQIIENRINVYLEKTAPIIGYYEKKRIHFPIQGLGTIEEIAGRLRHTIENLQSFHLENSTN
jgi:adenylate kinase